MSTREENEGVYIEHTTNTADGAITRRIPTTLPIPRDTLQHIDDVGAAVLVVAHEYLAKRDIKLLHLDIHPLRRLKYVGSGEIVKKRGGEVDNDAISCHRTGGCIPPIGSGFDQVQSIELCKVESIRHIPNYFLWSCPSLTSVDLSPFRNVTSIGRSFLSNCTSLTSIDLSPLVNVTVVGEYFMAGCTSLQSVNLSPLSRVATLCGFMDSCTSLKSIDFTPMWRLTTIGPCFMARCSSLTSITFCPSTTLSESENRGTTPRFLLHFCRSLRSIDLSPFRNVTEVGSDFLSSCSTLLSIDLSPLRNVKSIANLFMAHCASLQSIDLSPLSNVVDVGYSFMEGCTSLTTVDVTPMVKVTVVGEWFMHGTYAFTLSMHDQFVKEVRERKADTNDDISREEEEGGCRSRSSKKERCVVKAAVNVAVKAPSKSALTVTAKKVVVKAATKKRK